MTLIDKQVPLCCSAALKNNVLCPFCMHSQVKQWEWLAQKSHKQKLAKPGPTSKHLIFFVILQQPIVGWRIRIVKGSQSRACCCSRFRWRVFPCCYWHWAVWSLPRQAALHTRRSDASCGLMQEACCHSLSAGKGPMLGVNPSVPAHLTSSLVSALCLE